MSKYTTRRTSMVECRNHIPESIWISFQQPCLHFRIVDECIVNVLKHEIIDFTGRRWPTHRLGKTILSFTYTLISLVRTSVNDIIGYLLSSRNGFTIVVMGNIRDRNFGYVNSLQRGFTIGTGAIRKGKARCFTDGHTQFFSLFCSTACFRTKIWSSGSSVSAAILMPWYIKFIWLMNKSRKTPEQEATASILGRANSSRGINSTWLTRPQRIGNRAQPYKGHFRGSLSNNRPWWSVSKLTPISSTTNLSSGTRNLGDFRVQFNIVEDVVVVNTVDIVDECSNHTWQSFDTFFRR